MGEFNYAPVIDDMTWSYSRIDCFDTCPYQWFMKYICDAESSDMYYSSYGSFMHKLLCEYYLGHMTREEMLLEFLTEFKSNVKGALPKQSIVDDYIQTGIDYIKNFDPLPFETVSVEERLRFDFEGVPFVGVIDFLGKDDDGYVIVDHKSRKLKPRSKRSKPTLKDQELDDMLRQLYIYSAAVKEKYGEFPKYLCFNCFRTNQLIKEPFDKNKYEETVVWVKKKIEEIKTQDEFYPMIDYFVCKELCDVNSECCYFGGN